MTIRKLGSKPGVISFLSSAISIIIGLLFGYALLLALDAGQATPAMGKMLTNGISIFGNLLYTSMPLIMTGLAVAFAYKTGLFNIGASGQFTLGALFALFLGLEFQVPWYLCLLAAAFGGALWGFFPGIFKALCNVNEVITSIMFNWIGMNLVNLIILNRPQMIAHAWGETSTDRTPNLLKYTDKLGDVILPRIGLDKLTGYAYMNIGFIITIALAVLLWVILNKTTFGYELKACGLNRDASRYAGINAKRNIVLSMMIAGAMAGLGGAMYYLSGGVQFVTLQEITAFGFNGICVALLANCNPIACIFSAIFISYINLGGYAIQSYGFATEASDIVISVIIYLAALSFFLRGVITRAFLRHDTTGADANAEPVLAADEPVENQQDSSEPQTSEEGGANP